MRRLLPLILLPALLLAGCSGSPSASSDDGRVRVVASTDVWGDVVRQVGGSAVQVDSLIDDPDRDPHEFQADARDQLAVSRAQVVVVNGGGYDDFLDQLLTNAPEGTAVVDAVDASGLDAAVDGFNEHLWYSFDAVSKVAAAVAADLVEADPTQRAAFERNLTRFQARLTDLDAQVQDLRGSAAGKGVAITEPVPLYLTQALGLVDRTPPAFSEAIEEGDDVAPAVLQQQLALFTDRRVALLAINEQTTDATTERVVAAAKAADVPVVGVRETLPEGQGYLEWMQGDLDAIRTALDS